MTDQILSVSIVLAAVSCGAAGRLVLDRLEVLRELRRRWRTEDRWRHERGGSE